jgi:hypothetical protein
MALHVGETNRKANTRRHIAHPTVPAKPKDKKPVKRPVHHSAMNEGTCKK